MSRRPGLGAGLVGLAGLLSSGCKDVSDFSTKPGENYCGSVVQGPFVRAGFSPATQMRLKLDADALTTAPGELWTSDGMFTAAPLRVIPQLFHDPLSTLQFGEGRQRNLLYAAEPSHPGPGVVVVVSLMSSGDVEVRLLRSAPPSDPDAGAAGAAPESPLFGVFPLQRRQGSCGF